MTGDLARRYRRLLRAYPPGPRRDELLDTLLECAPPGRTRPRPQEVLNLTRHGLRARLGRPASTAVVVLAVLVSLVVGWSAAAGAIRLSWAFVGPLPTGAASRDLAATAFPGLTVWGGGDAEKFVPTGDGEGTRYGFADYWVKHTAETRDLRTYSAGVRDRLAAAGWRIQGEPVFEPSEPDAITRTEAVSFWATRGNLVLKFSDYYWYDRPSYDSDGAAAFQLWQVTPWWADAVAVLAGLVGLLAGWLLCGLVSRRTETRPGPAAVVAVLTWFALALMLPTLAIGVSSLLVRDGPPEEPALLGFAGLGGAVAALAGVVALTALIVAAVPWTRIRPRWAAAALVAVALVAVAVPYYRDVAPAALGGSTCAPSGPPPEPDPGSVRLSRASRVFIRQDTTPDQRNLIDAAIFRVQGTTALNFNYDPTSDAYRDAYCDGDRVPLEAGRRLPYFWDVWLSSPGAFPALEAELTGMPGVLAVRRALPTG